MGLDMMLYKVERDEIAYWRKANAIHAWFERRLVPEGEEMEDCKPYYVGKEDLLALKSDCEKVLKASKLVEETVQVKQYNSETKEYEFVPTTRMMIEDPTVAMKLLPTQSGFFFGSTMYDDDYLHSLENTIEQIDQILDTVDFDACDLEYKAWW